ncbi:MAG: aminoacyl-tRNA hydrolase [Clostridia bacterium]|nr:aminoacyl-tRNA hydrolase [Clostridia bacterium]
MLNFLKSKKETGPFEFLIVGLGNPGKKYEFTRHNAGFMCLDVLSDNLGVKINKVKFKSAYCECKINSHRCILMEPQTYMNSSGEAVREAVDFYKIPPENVIIIFDDISLDVGKMRIRRKGSAGGHNGIKSIIAHLGTSDFPRIKLGVGAKPHPDYSLMDWVLSSFSKDDLKKLRSAVDDACNALELMLDDKYETAMSDYNS